MRRDEPTLFSALLTPHRSLNRTGFLLLMAFIGVVSFVAGLSFLLMGAWPVFGFFGLDALAIYWAFKVNFHRAAAYEEIAVTPSALHVRRVTHLGAVVRMDLQSALGAARQTGDEEFGVERLYSGLPRAAALGIGKLSRAGRKSELCQSLNGGAADRQTRHHYNPA